MVSNNKILGFSYKNTINEGQIGCPTLYVDLTNYITYLTTFLTKLTNMFQADCLVEEIKSCLVGEMILFKLINTLFFYKV